MISIVSSRVELYDKFLPKNAIGAELGVYAGENAINLVRYANPQKLYLCDDWCADIPEHIYQAARQVALVYCRMEIVRQQDQHWLRTLPDKFLDWVYLDTQHTYEQTKLELQCLRGKVSQIIAGHDLMCTGYHNNVADTWDGGVMRALMEELAEGWLEVIAITKPQPNAEFFDLFPSWACRVKN